jgi:hypothetical protein
MSINRILAGLLVAQLALAAVTWWPSTAEETTTTPAITAPIADWTVVEIVGQTTGAEPPKPVRLVKEGAGWSIASAGGYPADPNRVKDVLDHLASIQIGNPISTKATSHRDLSVADDTFTRKVTVGAGGQTTTFYLGAGTGSAVNVRVAGTDAVYAVRGFTAWSIGDADARFYDSSYVKVDPKKLRTLKITTATGSWTLDHSADDHWTMEGTPEVPVDTAKIGTLARRAVDLRMTRPVGREVKPEFGLGSGARVEWTAEGDDGAPTAGGYTIGAARETFRYVKADDRDWVVEIGTSTLQPVLDFAPSAIAPGS